MSSPPFGPSAHSEACPLCGAAVDAQTPRAVNVALAPLDRTSVVVCTVHWECLLPRLHGVEAVAGPDPYGALFGPARR